VSRQSARSEEHPARGQAVRPSRASEGLLHIGEVAERVGLSLRTVRYYEEIGLVTPSARTEGGFRLYSESDVERLRVVKPMKPLGYALEEMGPLLALIEQGAAPDSLTRADLEGLVAGLGANAERADAGIAKLERRLAEARGLRLRIAEALARSEAILAVRRRSAAE
jgi:DNA-binding transcriptional MerR regulator